MPRTRKRPQKSRYLAYFESLELRRLLAATPSGAVAFGTAGNETVTGITAVPNLGGNGHVTYLTGTYTGTMVLLAGANGVSLTSKGGTDIFVVGFYDDSTIVWADSFGGTGNDVSGDLVIASNAVVVTGSFRGTMDADPGAGTTTLTSAGGLDGFFARLNETTGALTAAKSFGGTGDDTANQIAADSTGNIYYMGTFSGLVDLDPGTKISNHTSFGVTDTFLAKVSTTNNLTWVNHYSYDDTVNFAGIAVTAAGIPVIAGTFRGDIDLDGNEATSATFSSPGILLGFVNVMTNTGAYNVTQTFGDRVSGVGAEPLFVNSVALDSAGNIIVGGRFTGSINVDPGTTNILTVNPAIAAATGVDSYAGFVMKMSPLALFTWANAYDGTAASEVLDVTTDSTNNIYVVGDFLKAIDVDFSAAQHVISVNPGARTAFVASYDSTGAFIAETHPLAATGSSFASLVNVSSDGTPTVAGTFSTSLSFTTEVTGSPAATTVLNSTGGVDGFLLQFAQAAASSTPTVTLTITPTEVLPNQPVIMTITVVPPAATGTGTGTTTTPPVEPTGLVKIVDVFNKKSTTIAQVGLNGQGIGSFVYYVTGGGSHVITATYLGDATYATKAATSVTVTVDIPTTAFGSLDSTAGGILTGWAANLTKPTTALIINFFVDGILRGAQLANLPRPDITPFVGGASHGFTWQLPFLEAGTHIIRVVSFDPSTNAPTDVGALDYTSPSIFFDEQYYLSHNPDVAAAVAAGEFTSGYEHFALVGAQEGRNPSAYFNEMWYRQQNPDVVAAIIAGSVPSGFFQFIHTGTQEGRDPSPFFNEDFYRRANPDVAAAIASGDVGSGFIHFLRSGLLEGRSPTPWFNNAQYKAANPDVAAAFTAGKLRSAYDQFTSSGITELRAPSAVYNETFYVAQNSDVAAGISSHALASGLQHFIIAGFYEGRVSDPTFDTAFYLAQHPEVNALIADGTVKSAFQHFLLFGQLEGFTGHA